MMPGNRPTVLILSNDPTFARALAAHWPADANAPEFTVLEEGLFRDLIGCHYDLAIADASNADSGLKQALFSAAKPAILIHDGALPGLPRTTPSHGDGAIIELYRALRGGEPQGIESSEELQSWAAVAGLLGREILRGARAEADAREAEVRCAAAQVDATLGRYMVEMRHNINNALTSVLGNAELLTLEPGLPANAIAEADTVRNMALRLHEIFQRFSSIEKELSVAAREADKKAAQARAAGVS
jgi:signal transduction histidine kinase